MRRLTLLLLLCLGLHADDGYTLGEGVQVGALPLYLGGYFSMEYSKSQELQHYSVDDIALLSYGSYNRFSYLLELEFTEFYVRSNDNNITKSTQDHTLHLERIYLDYNLNENYSLRLGKYNSPVGFWNLLPINVLRETTSSPVSTEILFPKFTTGLDASYSSFDAGLFKVDLLLQHNDGLDESYNNYNVDQHYALGLGYEQDNISLKINGGYFHLDDTSIQTERYYLLISGKYEKEKYQFMAELGSQRSQDRFTTEYAGYLQGLYRLSPKHIAIARVESYSDKVSDETENLLVMGYTYRPLYPIALKAEYQLHSQSRDNQFLCSFSMLF